MLTDIHPKLPMRSKQATRDFYIGKLGFEEMGIEDFDGYLMLKKDRIELHFFEFKSLNPKENYGQIYIRAKDIDTLYKQLMDAGVEIHPNGRLELKPWLQKEFSLLDPDHNLLTFGEDVFPES